MRRSTILALIMVLALALAACAPAVTATEPPVNNPTYIPSAVPTISVPVTGDTETAVAPSVGGDVTGTSTADAALATSTSETTSGTGPVADTGVRIGTSTSTAASEPFLVDQQGRALYLYTSDTQNGGSSTSTAECLTQWQPLIVTGTPQAGNGVNASLLATIDFAVEELFTNLVKYGAASTAEVQIDVAVIDEAQAIKNPSAGQTKAVKRLQAEARIALTKVGGSFLYEYKRIMHQISQ